MARRPERATNTEADSDARPAAVNAVIWWSPCRGLHLLRAAQYVGLGKTTWQELVDKGDAPQPVDLTPGRKVWLIEELDHWLDERAARRQDQKRRNTFDEDDGV